MLNQPIMMLLGGINGAGKTTFYYQQLMPELGDDESKFPFVNADEIERKKFPNEVGQHSLEMGKLAAIIRDQYLDTKQSFITETVFSHHSKNELITRAQEKGFFVHLNHIHVGSAELAYKRVQDRVSAGGHDVPKEKVETRYQRTVDNISKAAETADVTVVWDNSAPMLHQGIVYKFVLEMHQGKIIAMADRIPAWAEKIYQAQISEFRD